MIEWDDASGYGYVNEEHVFSVYRQPNGSYAVDALVKGGDRPRFIRVGGGRDRDTARRAAERSLRR